MRVGLSDDDSVYDLNFITEKLAKVTVYQERASDIQLKLTKISIPAQQVMRDTKALLTLKEKQLKASDEYNDTPVHQKGNWLANQLADVQAVADNWQTVTYMVSTIKEAVNERAGTLKRLDSDIRLHAKLYEQRVAAGASGPHSYTGDKTGEIDL